MKKILFFIAFLIIPLLAQDITNKLGGDTANETYDVTDSNDNVLFRVQGDGGALFVNNAIPGTIPMQGIGDRMMWYPAKGAFRAGYVDSDQWDDKNIGNYSTAMGGSTTASGDHSTAMGSSTTASRGASTAMGYNTTASGVGSTAMGGSTIASGMASTAMGGSTIASGEYSTAMGSNTIANTANGLALGLFNTSSTNHLLSVGNGASEASRNDAFVVTIDGKVGIGTANPDELLHIGGDMRLDGTFEDKDGDAGTAGQILSSTVTGTDWIDAPSGSGIDDDDGVPEVYGSGWDGDGEAPTKNDLYDKISVMDTNISSNDSDISTNQSNISTNTTNIGNNITSIQSNDGDIANNASNIAVNTAKVTDDDDGVPEVYGSGWNGDNEAPTKNDVYDKIETLSATADDDDGVPEVYGSGWDSDGEAPTKNDVYDKISATDTNITANDSDISTNQSNISTNTTSIQNNDTDIANNANNISNNTTAIALNTAKVSDDDDGVPEVYGSGWNGDNEAPTKNDVYDKIESLPLGGSSWGLAGNSGTVNGTNFVGTTDNTPLEFKVNNERMMRYESNAWNSPNIIGGYFSNNVSAGIYGAFIGGGGTYDFANRVTANFGSVLGGRGNTASGYAATAMGLGTTAEGNYSTSIGFETTASGLYSTAVGCRTIANGDYSTVIGKYVTIAADGEGTFAISDQTKTTEQVVSGADRFWARFDGGYTFWSSSDYSSGVSLPNGASSWVTASDSTMKENFQKADGEYFLKSIKELKLGSWNYKTQDSSIRHYGPMAQDIFKYFGKDDFGTIGNDTTLATADMDGILMIAIQVLINKNSELEDELSHLKQQILELKAIKD